MAPLGVDPLTLDAAGAEVVTASDGLASVIATLLTALSGCAGMAGDDPAGAALGHSYDNSAARILDAMVTTRNGLCGLGIGVRMSAHNYSLAEAMSNVGGGGSPLPTPPPMGSVPRRSVPSAVGSIDSAPAGWGWVAPYIGMIWPTGDSARLRAAATAWNTAGAQFAAVEILGTGGPMGAIRAQHIPEGPLIDHAFADAYSSAASLVQQCQRIANQLIGYAAQIDKVHAAILDLLSRICDPMTGIKEIWDILTDEDEDEIRKIAEDIRTVIDNFRAEVEALEADMASTLAEAAAIVSKMANYAQRQWDQFLHTTDVGRFVNQLGHGVKEFADEGIGAVEGAWRISQVRMLVDPLGYAKDVGGMVLGSGSLVGLGPEGGPGIGDAWKTLSKDVSHWDQWDKDPIGAFSRSLFDVGTLALPGGPLSKLGTRSRAAVDALKGLRKPPLPKPPDPPALKPPETTRPPAAPGGRPMEPGSPSSPKPTSAPPGAPLPHSPVEPKPPISQAPKATAPPPVSAGKPPVPVPAESTSTPHPSNHAPAGSGLTTPQLPSPPNLPSAPHLPSAPAGGALSHGGTPHGGEPGGHPHGPHDGPPHPPGDGQPPHAPGDGQPPADGTPHEPGDGSPPEDAGDSSPGDHPQEAHEEVPPKAREVFPLAKEFGELTREEYRNLFEDADGNLRYPDSDSPTKPYAVPGTIHDLTDAEIQALDGSQLDRIGYPGGEWLAPAGTPYEERALPHTSLDKPYNVYTVHADVGLPSGWKIELSTVSGWFGHPGGGPQYRLMAPEGAEASVQELLDTGFLTED